nr:hypothetical protein JVH1_4251 [Rhodococcus sp. JVH1]
MNDAITDERMVPGLRPPAPSRPLLPGQPGTPTFDQVSRVANGFTTPL